MNINHKGHEICEVCGKKVLSTDALYDHIKNIHKIIADMETSFVWSELVYAGWVSVEQYQGPKEKTSVPDNGSSYWYC